MHALAKKTKIIMPYTGLDPVTSALLTVVLPTESIGDNHSALKHNFQAEFSYAISTTL